jgi:hypothetical protein
MKKPLILLVILMAVIVLAQSEPTTIVVKEATVATGGVLIVTADQAGKPIELQCTQSMSACVSLKNGKYVMVQLPKNHGMYDCQNVDIYADGANPATAQKIGQYCLTQK